jgi:hypothetical protein
MPRLLLISLLIALAPIRVIAQDRHNLTPEEIDVILHIAETADPAQSTKALARLHSEYLAGDNSSIDLALATLHARAVAVGDAGLVRRIKEVHAFAPENFARAMRTALRSSHTQVEELNLLEALRTDRSWNRLPADNPLYEELMTLLLSDDRGVAQAAVALLDSPAARQSAIDWVLGAISLGSSPPPEVIGLLKPDPRAAAKALTPLLANPNPTVRLLALRAMQAAGVDATDFKPTLIPMLRDPDRAIATAAAQLLGDPHSLAVARVPEILDDLRADSPTLRETAARQLEELDLFPKPLTTALRRAVKDRDMPTREGLILAIDQAFHKQIDPIAALNALAKETENPTTKAYVKAALRQLTTNN